MLIYGPGHATDREYTLVNRCSADLSSGELASLGMVEAVTTRSQEVQAIITLYIGAAMAGAVDTRTTGHSVNRS